MKYLRLFYLFPFFLLLFSKSSIGQVPDFSKVPNVHDGDSLNISRLVNNGIKITKGKAICWFPKDSLSEKLMNAIADTLNTGITEAEKFIKAPLSWQQHAFNTPYTFYFRLDSFVSHASCAGFVSIPFWRIKERKAPWLHEALHEMLVSNIGSWFSPAITDDFLNKNEPTWLFEGLPDYITMKVSNLNNLLWFDVFSKTYNLNIDSVFIENMKTKNGRYILSYIGNKGIMPELSSKERIQYAPAFYHGSCSFVQFIAGKYGLEILLTAISSFQKEQETIVKLTGKTISTLKKEWLNQLGIPE